MVLLRAKAVRRKVRELKRIIEEYKEIHSAKERDYAAYEKCFKRRLGLNPK